MRVDSDLWIRCAVYFSKYWASPPPNTSSDSSVPDDLAALGCAMA